MIKRGNSRFWWLRPIVCFAFAQRPPESHPDPIIGEESTYDGFDWGGERVAEEVRLSTSFSPLYISHHTQVLDAIRKIEDSGRKVTHFSVTGYSLGGLIARYMIGYVPSIS
jgi:hypothetical protein